MSRKSFPPVTFRPKPHRPPTREEIERARTMYREGFTVSRCLAATDMSLGTFYYWLDGGPREATRSETSEDVDARDKRGHDVEGVRVGSTLLPPIPRRKHVVGKRRKPLKTDRVSLTARLWRTAERQVRDIEERLSTPSSDPCRASPERERDVRMLSMLTRTLRDLSAFDVFDLTGAGEPRADSKKAPPGLFADEPPEDMDEFRNELARRIDALVADCQQEEAAQAAQGVQGIQEDQAAGLGESANQLG